MNRLKVLDRLREKGVPEGASPEEQRTLDYIAEVSKNARSTWFALNALLLFCGVTLLGVSDKDFFEYGAKTQLPLIGLAVPTKAFFWTAPFLVTAFYSYLHLYLDKLWRQLTPEKLGPIVGGRALDETIYPWLLADAAVSLRSDVSRRDRFFNNLTRLSALGLAWLFGPLVMFFFWSKSFAVHDEIMSLVIGLLFVFAITVGCYSLYRLPIATPRTPRSLGLLCVVFLTAAISLFGYAATEKALIPGISPYIPLHSANLYRADIVERPKDWTSYNVASREYRRNNLATCTTENHTSKHDCDLRREFSEARREAISALNADDFREADLRNADLREAFLVGLNLSGARLEGANLIRAQLEGADLSNARLDKARMMQARLEGAWFHRAQLVNAVLLEARLDAAYMSDANLEKAQLQKTKLNDANLRNADLRAARFTFASLDGADLSSANLKDAFFRYTSVIGANLEGVRNLTQDQLDGMFGDGSTPENITTERREDGERQWVVYELTRPAHWPTEPIPKSERYARWREWAIDSGAREGWFPEREEDFRHY